MNSETLELIVKILSQVNPAVAIGQGILEVVMGFVRDKTPDMTNDERIAMLRAAGLKVVNTADEWLAAHPV